MSQPSHNMRKIPSVTVLSRPAKQSFRSR